MKTKMKHTNVRVTFKAAKTVLPLTHTVLNVEDSLHVQAALQTCELDWNFYTHSAETDVFLELAHR